MSAPGNPPVTGGPGPRWRASYTGPNLRVSDAERAEAAERLSGHYADGRLDEATFNERLDQAMSAKIQSDLSALFTDLPGAGAPQPAPRTPPAVAAGGRRARRPRILFLVFVIVVAAAVGHALANSYVPWVLFGLLAFGWLRYGPRRRGRP